MLVSRDGDDSTGERIWQGPLIKGDTYLLAVSNESDVEIEYWLFLNLKLIVYEKHSSFLQL